MARVSGHVTSTFSTVSDIVLKCLCCIFVWQSYFYNDDTFNFNYAQAKAAVGNYKEAEEVGCHFSCFPWQ